MSGLGSSEPASYSPSSLGARQHRCGSVQGLDLRFLIYAKDEGYVGRIEIEAHDVAHVFDKEGLGLSLKVSTRLGLSPDAPPSAANRRLAHPRGLGQGPGR
jgi:hypothetical protein